MIDEERTLELFGYTSDELKPKSAKKIVATCEECGSNRILPKQAYRDICQHCAAKRVAKGLAKTRTYPLDYTVRSIDYAETLKRFGYTGVGLPAYSHKKIVVVCVGCGGRREVTKSKYNDLCKSCAFYKREANSRIGINDGALISADEEATFKEFGYKSFNLIPTSAHPIVAVCIECKKPRVVEKRNYTDLCHVCTMKSEAHRMKSSATHQGISYDEWESFATNSQYCPKFNEACRESNREKYDRRCFLSGITEEENSQKLSVHHIDMDKAQGCDGHAWKLVPLCRKLHSTSHTSIWTARIQYLLKHVWVV